MPSAKSVNTHNRKNERKIDDETNLIFSNGQRIIERWKKFVCLLLTCMSDFYATNIKLLLYEGRKVAVKIAN